MRGLFVLGYMRTGLIFKPRPNPFPQGEGAYRAAYNQRNRREGRVSLACKSLTNSTEACPTAVAPSWPLPLVGRGFGAGSSTRHCRQLLRPSPALDLTIKIQHMRGLRPA